MQDLWLCKKTDEILFYPDHNDFGPTVSGSPPLLSADENTLITDKETFLNMRENTFMVF